MAGSSCLSPVFQVLSQQHFWHMVHFIGIGDFHQANIFFCRIKAYKNVFNIRKVVYACPWMSTCQKTKCFIYVAWNWHITAVCAKWRILRKNSTKYVTPDTTAIKYWKNEACQNQVRFLTNKFLNLFVHKHIQEVDIKTYKQWHCQRTSQMYKQINKI
jgi:hypothetical protein